MIKNLEQYPIVKQSSWDKAGLEQFEKKMADHWEAGKVRGPIHLSGGNEDELIEIGKRISAPIKTRINTTMAGEKPVSGSTATRIKRYGIPQRKPASRKRMRLRRDIAP